MTHQTATEYLADLIEEETGYWPDTGQIDIGFHNRMVEALKDCDYADIIDDTTPVYTQSDLKWAYERAGEEE